MIRGLDVSHFQGSVNWKTRKAQYNLSFGAGKCTEGTTFTDSEYAANRAGAKAAGLPFIAYHYARPEQSSALVQAKRLVTVAGKVDALCLDLEASQLGQSETNAWMRAFGDALRTLAPGVTTMVYLGGYAANGSGQGSVSHFDRWWYPRYPGSTAWPSTFAPRIDANTTGWAAPPAPHIWQFTPDMAGMDADVSNLTIAQLFSHADPGELTLSSTEFDQLSALIRAVPALTLGQPIPSLRPESPGEQIALRDYIAAIDLDSRHPPADIAAAIAAAVVAALPPVETGGLTADQVKQAVKDALREGVGA